MISKLQWFWHRKTRYSSTIFDRILDPATQQVPVRFAPEQCQSRLVLRAPTTCISLSPSIRSTLGGVLPSVMNTMDRTVVPLRRVFGCFHKLIAANSGNSNVPKARRRTPNGTLPSGPGSRDTVGNSSIDHTFHRFILS